jgi:hypothetical protein
MKINQLFRTPVSTELCSRVLECFGLNGWGDCTPFSRHDLERIGTARRMGQLMCELDKYYIPCKGRVYLVAGSLNKCITILKQLSRLYGHRVLSREHTVNKEKIIMYHLSPGPTLPECPTQQTKPKVSVCHVRVGTHRLCFQ